MSGFKKPGESGRRGEFGVVYSSRKKEDVYGGYDEDVHGGGPIVDTLRYSHYSLEDQRRMLPIYRHKMEILYLLERHSTIILVGETGSGKTTQIPRYLYDAGWCGDDKMIACTQPRRVAVMSIAARVCEELGVRLGEEVGYSIRFEDVTTPGKTRLKFCTDGVLLREIAEDPLLSRYSVVMVDEAHERSVTTDALLSLLKKIQKRRNNLRVIISSATIDAETFASFFLNPKTSSIKPEATSVDAPSGMPGLLSVQGRSHAVHMKYLDAPCDNYLTKMIETVYEIHESDLPGDILCFLTGQEECDTAMKLVRDYSNEMYRSKRWDLKLKSVALYAGLPGRYQLSVFDSAPPRCRKVVFATNIAETSITIDGIVHVVDCMFSKQKMFEPLVGVESLVVAPISKASARQRSGRAGRVRPGYAYRLCTEDMFQDLHETDRPEMQRSDLTSLVIQLKGLGIDNLLNFSWLAPPPSESMVRSLESLHALGALDDDAKLTAFIGTYMSELPIDALLSRCLLQGWIFNCVLEVATVISMLQVETIWASGPRKQLDLVKSQFAVAEGDLISYLNIWKAWEESGRDKKWSIDNFVSHRSMLRASDIRSQLMRKMASFKQSARQDDPIFGSNSLHQVSKSFLWKGNEITSIDAEECVTRVRRAFVKGLFLNAVQRHRQEDADGQATYSLLRNTGDPVNDSISLQIHPSSLLYTCQPEWMCYYKAQQTAKDIIHMQHVLTCKVEWFHELAPHYWTSCTSRK